MLVKEGTMPTVRDIYKLAAALIGDKNDISNSTSGLTARNIYTIAAALIGEKDDNTNGRSNMTVRDVYVIAAAFIGDRENDDQDEIDFAPIYFRTLLQEALPAENRIRVAEGLAELTEAPALSIDDTIPYSDKIVRGALPYGLAWQYHQDAGNLSLASQYRNMFIEAVENVKKSKINLTTAYLNILMQEALDCENSIREYFGETTLTSAPFISSLDSVIPYHDSLVRAAFPYGLAWQYHQDAGNFQEATKYRDLFTDAVEKAKKTKIMFAIAYTNILMQESFNCENSIRAAHREPLLGSTPLVEDLDNGLVYHDELVRAAFPYGLAWQYHQDAGNLQLATQYRGLFEDAVNRNYCFTMRKYR